MCIRDRFLAHTVKPDEKTKSETERNKTHKQEKKVLQHGELTQSCLMLPSKSSSGIFFISENDFNNCRYCPKLECPNRSAPFEKELESAQEYKSIFAEKPIL